MIADYTGVCEKNTPPEKNQIRGWIAVSAVVLKGKGLHKRMCFSPQTPVSLLLLPLPLLLPLLVLLLLPFGPHRETPPQKSDLTN